MIDCNARYTVAHTNRYATKYLICYVERGGLLGPVYAE